MDVICTGLMVVDALGRTIDRFPEPGKLVLFESMGLDNGGCAINTAAALGRLGVSAGVIGRVGDDSFADFLFGQLEKHGVDGSLVVRDPSSNTAFTFVCVSSSGERCFLHTVGANARLRLDDMDFDEIAAARIFHVAGHHLLASFDGEPAAEALRRARAAGVITTLDTVYNDQLDDWMALVEPCLPHLSYFMPSREEAAMIAGTDDVAAMARLFRGKGAERVVIKLGGEGSYYFDGEAEIRRPCFDVDVVDTTGAGDAFIGGFLYGVLNSMAPADCLTWGNAVAAQCVSALGASSGLRDLEGMTGWLRTARPRGG